MGEVNIFGSKLLTERFATIADEGGWAVPRGFAGAGRPALSLSGARTRMRDNAVRPADSIVIGPPAAVCRRF
jgi:hypothetical protein